MFIQQALGRYLLFSGINYLFPVFDWEYLLGGSASNPGVQGTLPDFVLIVEAEPHQLHS
jgi:hypothetical protein